MSVSKQKYTTDDMIKHFKQRNVTFNLMNEDEAKEVLQHKTYFFKLKSYKANFPLNQHGQFKKLDFGMLMDISIIDSRLRNFVLNVTLNIEHTLKTKLLKLISDDSKEDGYQIINEFIQYNNSKTTNPKDQISLDSLWGKITKNHPSYEMYNSYKSNPPLWVIFEVISYSNLIKFAEFYKNTRIKTDVEFKQVITNLKHVKFLRNMAAHSSPMIRNIQKTDFQHPNSSVKAFLRTVKGYKESREVKYLHNRIIHHFIATMYVFDKLVTSKGARENTYRELKELTIRSRKEMKHYPPNIYTELMWRYLLIRKVSKHLR